MKKNRLQRFLNWLLTIGTRKNLLYPQNAGDNQVVDNHAEQDEKISKFIVQGASMSRIDDMEDKQFWERKFTKDVLKALKKKSGIKLSQEYEEKLEKLDEIRPGDIIYIPTATVADNDVDHNLLLKLSLYFKDEDTTKRFLNSARQMKDKEIITLVKNYKENHLCSDTSINLWRVLNDAQLYKATYANWNKQLKKEIWGL